jgi:AraC-like DNA-binding protein
MQMARSRLEGLREASAHIRLGKSLRGLERLEAHFRREGFSPHRHDTYAIGVTLSGVQTFRYRGARRYCLPQQCHVLHPDEVHDGSSAAESGFSYRILHIDPSLLQQALGGQPLPFVADPVVELPFEKHGILLRAWDVDDDLDDLDQADIVVAVVDALLTVSPLRRQGPRTLPLEALQRVRDQIIADPVHRRTVEQLEHVAGLDRWTLARDFRAAYGTSPRSFRTMRQLDRVRRLIMHDSSLANAALEAGFCDQSHMSRMFKRAYGLTPVRWAAAVAKHGAVLT